MRWVRWLLVLAGLAACAYAVVGVEFGGRTLIERLRGSGSAGSATSDGASDKARSGRPVARPATPDAGPAAQAATDQLTDEDRAGLDHLIKTRLQDDSAHPAAGPQAPAPKHP